MELEEAVWAKDREGLGTGLLESGEPVESDQIVLMKVGQVRTLLKNNGIDFNKKKGTSRGLCLTREGDLERATDFAIECTEVNVFSPEYDNYTTYSYQYDEFVSRLHMSAMTKGESSVGVPGIFSVSSSHKVQHATRTDTRRVREHKSFSVIIPRAQVSFKREKVSPTQDFVNKVTTAVHEKTDPAKKLLTVFKRYGEFFATDITLGGRLNMRHDKAIDQSYTEEKNQTQFLLACKAAIPTEGGVVDGAGSWGVGLTNQEKNTVNQQSEQLKLEMRGGNSTQTQPNKWIKTTGKYLNWKVIGYRQSSLEPIFNYLTDDLRAKCIQTLRKYFLQQEILVGTALVGAKHASEFGNDAEGVKRIVLIKVHYGRNIDGLTVTNELKTGELKENTKVAYGNYEKVETIGPLDANEEICAMEGGVAPNKLLRELCFYTTLGRRFPAGQNTYYGRAEGAKLTPFRIEAPRVRSITGHAGKTIDSVGFRYLEFQDGTQSPEFLRAIEPYLFPTSLPNVMHMTTRGMLVAGKWRRRSDLTMETDDGVRNTLIVEIGGHSKDGPDLQGFSDARLVEMASIIVFLMAAKIHDRQWLQTQSAKEHRGQLIRFIHGKAGKSVASLEALSDAELVRWGFALKPEAAKELGEWDVWDD